jgi:5-methyltetrahydrofolate--homocysteine methyltransferase
MADLAEISALLQKGKAKDVVGLVQAALEEGVAPGDILDQSLLDGMGIIGEKFKNNEVYVPEVLIAARAMNQAMAVLEEKLAEAGIEPKGKIVMGTVKGDLHDIGKNLVGMMFKGGGFEVIDCGIDVSPEKFVETAKEHNADLIGVSALLTTTMPSMKDVVDKVNEEGLSAKVMIGGAPVTQAFADEIGAHGYAADAATAVDVGKALIGVA